MDSLVSIVIPTYNRLTKLTNCLQSILAQSYSNIEIIVVDDGSTDETESHLNAMMAQGSSCGKLRYLRQDNQGAPVARNKGLQMAKGEYIVFFDSDDLMLKERIQKQVSLMESEKSDCCACGFYTNSEEGELYLPKIKPGNSIINSLIKWDVWGSTQSWMFKRNLILEVGGYDANLKCYQDWDLAFRVLVKAEKISILKQPLSVFFNEETEDRITSKIKFEKRLPSIQTFFLKVLKWYTTAPYDGALCKSLVFAYVHGIVLKYRKFGFKQQADMAYQSFLSIVSDAPLKRKIELRQRLLIDMAKGLGKVYLKMEKPTV